MRTVRLLTAAATFPLLVATAPSTPGAVETEDRAQQDLGQMVLVLDASGSMAEDARGGQTRIEAARESLNAVVDSLSEDQPVGMRVFGANETDEGSPESCRDSERVVDVDTGNADALRAAIAAYEPVGWTPTSHALREAARDLGDGGQRTIVLVSDGEPTCDPDPCEVAEELAEDGIELTIDVIGLDVSGDAKSTLQCVANRGNGSYYDADSAESLTGALIRSADRSARPYSAIGTPVEGAAQPEGAPVIGAGDWLDRIGTDRDADSEIIRKHYIVERAEPGSTLSVSATINRPDEETASEYLVVEAKTPEGVTCGRHSSARGTQYSSRLSVGGFLVRDIRHRSTDCAEASEFRLLVQRGFDTSDGGHAQIEAPLELRIVEEPAVEDVESLPEEREAPEDAAALEVGEAEAVIGGSSFGQAPTLTDGTYGGTIVAGETQVFFVDVGWGQQLRTRLDMPQLSETQSEQLGRSLLRTGVRLLTPARLTTASNSVQISTRRGGELAVDGHPAVYRNREVRRNAGLRASSIAGSHAVVVSAFDKDADTPGVEIPFTLTVLVDGEVQGDPGYDDPIVAAAPAPTETATDATADDDSRRPWTWIGLGTAGLLVLALTGAVLVRRFRS